MDDNNFIRSAKDNDFPYSLSTVCYFEAYKDGRVKRIHHKNKCNINEVEQAYDNAKKGITKIYAVWPGNWQSDLFIIDDIEAFINAIRNK